MTRAVTGLAIALLCAPFLRAETTGSGGPVTVRFGGNGANTRVVIDSDAALSGTIIGIQPGRAVISLSGLGLSEQEAGGGLGLVKSWRLTPRDDGARLTLVLSPDTQIHRRFVIAPAQGGKGWRYVIDIGAATPGEARSLPPTVAGPTALTRVASEPPPPGRPGRGGRASDVDTTPLAAPSQRKVVVIDAGHGGHDPGAQSADASEKDITLAAALALRARLERTGRYKVVMTRATDVFIPLETRVQIARRAGADLFIALHADSAGADSSPHGASVYTLSDHGETRVGEVLGRDEWFSHAGGRRGDPEVGRILLDLTQRSTKNRSAVFASLLVDRLTDRIDLLPHSHRDAGYFVLLAPDVPAVLLEMGFITSPLDEARLTDPAQRGQLMDAVAEAIDTYFAGQTQLAER